MPTKEKKDRSKPTYEDPVEAKFQEALHDLISQKQFASIPDGRFVEIAEALVEWITDESRPGFRIA